jgi:hypothetical protein
MDSRLFHNFKRLDRSFWKCFPRQPIAGLGIVILLVLIFLGKLLNMLLTPEDVREGEEETWKND